MWKQDNRGDGEALLLLAAAVSIQLAQGKSTDDLAFMAAFFEVLGDNLALLATRLPQIQPEQAQRTGDLAQSLHKTIDIGGENT